ncbi:MAG: primosomal protein N' [Bacteroidales bacterium]|nr:primosomal protein N' [Bacteroidales bacterium]
MARQTLFADILLPLPLKGCFTYRVPLELNDVIRVGQRAVVPFGRNKVYAGLVKRLHEKAPRQFQARYIHSLLDDEPVVTSKQFDFWEWIADYYLCTEGEVMNAALPPAMKLSGETRIALNPDTSPGGAELNEKEQALLDALQHNKQLSLSQASSITSLPRVLPLIKTMMDKGLLLLKEELDNPWRPRREKHVRLHKAYRSDEALKEVFDYCERRAPRQLALLMQYIRLSGLFNAKTREVRVQELTAGLKGSNAALNALDRRGVFELYDKVISYFDHLPAVNNDVRLNEDQERALQDVRNGFETHDVVLLHGVTSSGKTELYIRLIRETIERGEQVLYLLPEIALTAQIISRLQQHFGNRAGIYHSRFNPMERTEVWNNLLRGGVLSGSSRITYDLVLGPRSAMFLPFRKPGLIIIDEEHEPSFKQHDPAPRYHARDAAIYLASLHGAKVLLGSATPSLEVMAQVHGGKFGYARIDKRHGGVMMPEILVADIRRDIRSKAMKSHFSALLYASVREALDAGEQVILFQNRRGFSLRLECDVCHWLPGCHQCDVTLVYHKKINKLKCHYCGYTAGPPGECPECGSAAVRMKGFGTEKIEEELPLFFPEAKVARMDLDTTRSKNAYGKIIDDFEQGRIDILVGTQMVSKGLDFSNVGVVGILNADNMLSFPDFRSHERAFQLMAQVGGRAGRLKKRGKVIIQTYNPSHPIIKQVTENDYEGMYRQQIAERREFHYPPFTRLVLLSILHPDEALLNRAAEELAGILRRSFPKKVFGPEYPVVSRIRNQYIKNILIKLPRSPKLKEEKEKLRMAVQGFQTLREWKPVRIIYNADPV